MTDRVPGAPGQYKAVITPGELQKMQAGQEFVITMQRDDQPTVMGTPYNKASVLPDDVAGIICPGVSDPVPADALRNLAGVRRVVQIPNTGWSNGKRTVTVTGVTPANTVLVSPEPSDANYKEYCMAGVRCVAQGTDSLTFACDTVPAAAVNACVAVLV